MNYINCTGQKYGRLIVLDQRRDLSQSQSRTVVLARCDCGIEKEYILHSLRSGRTKSCGCLLKEVKVTHGMYGSQSYIVWSLIIQRCKNSRNTQFFRYGARGVTVCDRWLKFKNFYADMGDKPKGLELDRINNNKGYYKENCRWVTRSCNMENTCRSKWWFINGVRYESSVKAAVVFNINPETVRGWCQGYSQCGVYYPPKPGCYSELKYK